MLLLLLMMIMVMMTVLNLLYSSTEGGINGHGGGVVTSRRTFDREKQKEYYIPIVMRDSGSPSVSGTSTLTVVVGDVNDNQHHAAFKAITVHNYKGEFTRMRLAID